MKGRWIWPAVHAPRMPSRRFTRFSQLNEQLNAPVAVALLAAATLAVAGCAATSATSSFPRAGEPGDVAAALARAGAPRAGVVNATGRPMVFATGGGRVVAYDLQGERAAWTHADEPGQRIAVSGPTIAYARKDGTLVARDPADGRVRWEARLPGGRRRIGYAAGASALFDVTVPAGGGSGGTLVAHDAVTGSVEWRIELPGEIGAPAVHGAVVAVPRRSQFVTLVDASSGKVLAHILSQQEAATFVRALPEGLFFGSRGVYLASAETAMGARDGGGYLTPKLPPFVRGVFHWDMYRAEQLDYSAIDRNRVLWRVATRGPKASFADDLVVVHNFRFFFGLAASSGALRWAYSHPREDAVASELTAGHLFYVAADGALGAVALASGQRVWQGAVGQPGTVQLRGATFDVEGWAPPTRDTTPQTLPRTLASILWDPDRRFIDVKTYAIAELARLPGREVTAELLRALEGSELPPQVVHRATDALIARHDQQSLQLYREALKARSDYAEDRRPPRLDVLARAVATTRSRDVVPALLEHVLLPDTPADAIRDIADAALATAASEAVAPFQAYLLMYRAYPPFQQAPGPLLAAADVLLQLGGPAARTTLLHVLEEPRTVEALRVYLERTLFTAAPGPARDSR